MATVPQKPPTASPNRALALRWRVLITLALLIHFAAVIAAPMSVPYVGPPGEIPRYFAGSLSPYIFATYLNHGYRFFAPEPSPGHLVRYTLELPDGTSRTGEFPDIKTEWPRLFYHRHFMLSEKLANLFNPEEPGLNDPPEARAAWQADRQLFNTIIESYARYLLKTSGARRVKLEYIQHELPSPADLESDRPLNHPKSYTVLWTGSYGSETL